MKKRTVALLAFGLMAILAATAVRVYVHHDYWRSMRERAWVQP